MPFEQMQNEEDFNQENFDYAAKNPLNPLTLTPSLSTRKGKEKITEEDQKEEDEEEEDVPMDSTICGICLCEEGEAVRGWIDSCNHYFCFVCIMEWARVESRCPMCKQRFGSILRPKKPGIFEMERLVNVPVRDQVFYPHGNADPYEHTSCCECLSSVDENLLLLCDLCESASHTYCVGLGSTVPEGDWYCNDCSISRNQKSIRQMDTDFSTHCFPNNFRPIRLSGIDAPISELVREDRESHVFCARSVHLDQPNGPTTPILGREPFGNLSSGKSMPEQQPARTLHRCRNLQGRIKALRENWNDLRSGYVSFSSNLLRSDGASSTKTNNAGAVDSCNSSQGRCLSSTKFVKTMKENNSSDNLSSRGSDDVDRAWKMLKIAKAMQGPRRGPNANKSTTPLRTAIPKPIPNTCRGTSPDKPATAKDNIKRVKTHRSSSFYACTSKPFEYKVQGTTTSASTYRHNALEQVYGEHNSKICETQKRVTKLPYAKQVLKLSVVDTSHENAGKLSQLELPKVTDSIKGQGLPTTAVSSLRGGSNLSCSSSTGTVHLSGGKVVPSKGQGRLDKESGGILRKDDGIKKEIQSVVKLNLKLLSKNKQLGVERFKEVAKLATHTILAACGLNHSEFCIRPFPNFICTHLESPYQCHKSSLMPGSCRQCFYVFVKEVVNLIMTEKLCSQK